MRNRIGTFGLAALLAIGATAAARGEDLPAAGKAPSAKSCVEAIVGYAKKGDFDSAFSFMVPPWNTAIPKLKKSGDAVAASTEKLKKAMEAKFGPGAGDDPMLQMNRKMPQPFEGNVEIVDVKEEGDTATVKTKETKEGSPPKEETIVCKKVDGFWFANPPEGKGGPQDMPPEQQAKMFDALAQGQATQAADLDALAADVEGGKVATKEDAKQRIMQVQMKFAQSMQALMGGMARPRNPGGPKGGPGGPTPPPEKPKEEPK